MKKLIILFALLLSFSNTFATDSLAIDTSKVSEREVYNDVKIALTGLSKGLKVGSEHIYSVLIRQQFVNSFIYIAILILGILMIIPYYKGTKFCIKEDFYSYRSDYGFISIFGTIVAGITIILLVGIGIGHIDTIITGFVNPEYGAIEEIGNFIHH